MRKGIVDDGFVRIASRVLAQEDLTQTIQERSPVDLSKQIKEFRQDVSNAGLYYYPPAAEAALRHDVGLSDAEADQWIMLEGVEKQGTSYIDESNMNAIMEELGSGADPQDVQRASGGEVAVRVFAADGSLTAAGKIMQDVIAALSNYPVLDDQDVSQREYDATLENFESEGYGVVSDNAPADWPKQVFGWLWDNAQDQVWGSDPDADGGYWASRELIQQAARELGFAFEDEEEEEPGEDMLSMPVTQKGGRRRAQQQDLPLHENKSPELPPGFEGFSEEEIHEQRPAWQKALMEDLGRSPKKRSQAVPLLPQDEEELNPDEMEEVTTSPEQQGLEKFNWNDYIWGQFRKKQPARRYVSQMSLQDNAIIRMVTEEDGRLVKYRGGYAIVPLDGYAYPVDEAGAELALAHGAEDWTRPQEHQKAGSCYRSAGSTGNEIVDSMARTLFVDAWARDWEYLWEDYENEDIEEAAASVGVEVPSFQGAELMDSAPPTEDEAYVEAQKIYDSIEQANPGVDLATFLPPGYTDEDYFDRDSFGHYLAMQAMGSGVRWSDSHPDHGLKIPYRENNLFTSETERVREALAQMQESELTMTTEERDEE